MSLRPINTPRWRVFQRYHSALGYRWFAFGPDGSHASFLDWEKAYTYADRLARISRGEQ